MFYRFFGGSLDPQAREFRDSRNSLVDLSPKAFDCIVYLIEHRERAVGHDELISAVWGRVDVSTVQLGQLIRKIRRAIGEDETHNAIRTVPRFGFKWVADVQLISQEMAAGIAPPHHAASIETSFAEPTTSARVEAWPRIALTAGILGLLTAVTLTLLAIRREGPEGTALSAGSRLPIATRAVAVAPVRTHDDRADSGWLPLGGMDLIASDLHRAGIAVLPPAVVLAVDLRDTDDQGAVNALKTATSADRVLVSDARHTDVGWSIHLLLLGADGSREAEASAPEAITAIRGATAHLLAAMPDAASATQAPPAVESELLQRLEAAFLIDDYTGAQRLLAVAPESLRARPAVQLAIAKCDMQTGRFNEAEPRLQRLAGQPHNDDDVSFQAEIQLSLAKLAHQQGHSGDAIGFLDRAIALLSDRNEPELLGMAHNGRGVAHNLLGDLPAAAADFAQARIMLQLAGDSLNLARLDNNEGTLAVARGRNMEEATRHFQSAADTFARFGASDQYGFTLVNLISSNHALLKAQRALEVSNTAQSVMARTTEGRLKELLLYERGLALLSTGQLNETSELVASLRRLEPGDGTPSDALADALACRVAFAAGRFEEASRLARQAVATLQGGELAEERSHSWLVLIRSLRRLQLDTQLNAETVRFSEWAESLRMGSESVPLVESQLAVAESASAAGHEKEAVDIFEVLSQKTSAAAPDVAAAVSLTYGAHLLEHGDIEKAQVVVGRIARWTSEDFQSALLLARFYKALGKNEAYRASILQAHALAGERPVLEDGPLTVQPT